MWSTSQNCLREHIACFKESRKCAPVYFVPMRFFWCVALLTCALFFFSPCHAQIIEYPDAPNMSTTTDEVLTARDSMKKYMRAGAALPVKNIGAEAFFSDDHIKLNITWENPTKGEMPSGFIVKIIRQNSPLPHCMKANNYERFIHYKNITSVTVPSDTEHLFSVIPECQYRIEVKAQPFNDFDIPFTIYNVSECVGPICSCKEDHLIPQPKIAVSQVSKDTLRIKWAINDTNKKWTEYHNLSILNIEVYDNRDEDNFIHIMRNISNDMSNRENNEYLKLRAMTIGTQYKIYVFINNHQNCTSRVTMKVFTVQIAEDGQWLYQIMVPVMFLIMLSCCIWSVCKKISFWRLRKWLLCYNHQPSMETQVRTIYRHRGQKFVVPMEYNSLYVEKEILEERERGKADKYEVSYERLTLGAELGNGDFGQVFLARTTAIPGYNLVAVKKLKKTAPSEDLEEFLLEISMLKQIGRHPNIVTLLGCCTVRHPYCMIMEYVPHGDLLHYLRALRVHYEQKGKSFLFTMNKNFQVLPGNERQKLSDCSYITPESIPSNRLPSITETEYTLLDSSSAPRTPRTPVTPHSPHLPNVLECVLDTKELQSFAIQIARGMEHLESKQIVHRDLAARNVLIDENKTLKISDFGLSRSGIYVNKKNEKVPLRWLSVEAIQSHLYTSKSDIWAYGIVLWEIGTLGGFPYPTVANHEILSFLLKGKRLEKPENCTDELYTLMQKCWSHCGDQRPSFKEVVEYLEEISNTKRVYVDFDQLNPSYIFPPTEDQAHTQIRTENSVRVIEIIAAEE